MTYKSNFDNWRKRRAVDKAKLDKANSAYGDTKTRLRAMYGRTNEEIDAELDAIARVVNGERKET